MHILILLFAFVATSVAGPQRPDIDGACAKYLSRQGMLEIAAIPNDHPDIRKPVYHIMVTDRDRAEVYSGRRPQKYGDMFTVFEVHRKASHWRLVQGSVKDTELIRIYSSPQRN
jgi:hypothetical protein